MAKIVTVSEEPARQLIREARLDIGQRPTQAVAGNDGVITLKPMLVHERRHPGQHGCHGLRDLLAGIQKGVVDDIYRGIGTGIGHADAADVAQGVLLGQDLELGATGDIAEQGALKRDVAIDVHQRGWQPQFAGRDFSPATRQTTGDLIG